MKKLIAVILLLVNHFMGHSQKIVRDDVDKYLKIKVKETSWKVLASGLFKTLQFRCKSIDGGEYIEFELTITDAFRVADGDKIYLLLDNDESLPLACEKGGVADYYIISRISYWYGSYLYYLGSLDKDKLLAHKVTGVRVDLAGKYVTFNHVGKKDASKMQKALQLITE
jgi:hypothetical protein